MEVLGNLVIDYPGVVELVEPSKIHRNLVIESHQFWRLIEVVEVFVVINDLNHAFDQFSIDVHGVFVKAVVEVVSEFLVLGLAVGRVG